MAKVREKVTLRERKMKNGGSSLYLDWSFKGKRERLFLGLYLGKDKAANANAMRIASIKKLEKIEELNALEAGIFVQKFEGGNVDFKEYAFKCISQKENKRTRQIMTSHANRIPAGIKLASIDRRMFVQIYEQSTPGIGSNTKLLYFTFLRSYMRQAKKEGLIRDVPDLSGIAPKKKEGKRVFLTFDELQRFAAVDDPKLQRVKNLFLFSCFTGLRHSDTCQLKWSDISNDVMELRQSKTMDLVRIPLSDNAKAVMPEPNGKEYVWGRTAENKIAPKLLRICAIAGIDKHITFHCARHTCATLMLTYGTDIFTISKILGHSSVKTTQIYTKVMDEVKRKAVYCIPKI